MIPTLKCPFPMYLLKNFYPLFALTQTKQKGGNIFFFEIKILWKKKFHPINIYEEFTKAAVRLWRKNLILQSPK